MYVCRERERERERERREGGREGGSEGGREGGRERERERERESLWITAITVSNHLLMRVQLMSSSEHCSAVSQKFFSNPLGFLRFSPTGTFQFC